MGYRVIFLIILAILLAGCGGQEEGNEAEIAQDVEAATPQEAVDLAIEIAADECETLPGDSCQEFKLTCSEKLELAEADKANNVEEKWCLAIGYQKHSPTLGPDWKDQEGNFSVERVSSQWQEKGFCICRLGKEAAEEATEE